MGVSVDRSPMTVNGTKDPLPKWMGVGRRRVPVLQIKAALSLGRFTAVKCITDVGFVRKAFQQAK